jgi:ribosomal protein S18 acetylase RimI-like enzyme
LARHGVGFKPTFWRETRRAARCQRWRSRSRRLSVNSQNPALRLYERAGFQVVARDGDRLTMVKSL